MSAFSVALERVLQFEGGLSNHPADKGGLTNKGITQAVYDDYRKRANKPLQSVALMSDAECFEIYYDGYWVPGRCAAIEAAGKPLLAAAHFDACVNHGPGNAAKLLQRALHVDDDGIIGPATMTAVSAANDAEVTAAQLDARTIFFVRIVKANASQIVFLEGWIRQRVIDLRNQLIVSVAKLP